MKILKHQKDEEEEEVQVAHTHRERKREREISVQLLVCGFVKLLREANGVCLFLHADLDDDASSSFIILLQFLWSVRLKLKGLIVLLSHRSAQRMREMNPYLLVANFELLGFFTLYYLATAYGFVFITNGPPGILPLGEI